jgi:uncharacterized protein
MNLLVTGSTGLIGSALCARLAAEGHAVGRLPRGSSDVPCGVEGVVHLAGEPVAGRWSAAKKERILESRREGTRRLCEALARMDPAPRVLVSASAIGYYGDRGETLLGEDSPGGQGFLADVCRAWESACDPARARGIRVASLRFGVVLSASGGALATMLRPFRLGLGGRIARGRQWMSWVALDDVLEIVGHVLRTDTLEGPVNVVAPAPVVNAAFTSTLARVISRPAILPIPGFVLRAAFGEAADAMLLASQRVDPARLRATGFHWRYPELEPALRHLLGRGGSERAIG